MWEITRYEYYDGDGDYDYYDYYDDYIGLIHIEDEECTPHYLDRKKNALGKEIKEGVYLVEIERYTNKHYRLRIKSDNNTRSKIVSCLNKKGIRSGYLLVYDEVMYLDCFDNQLPNVLLNILFRYSVELESVLTPQVLSSLHLTPLSPTSDYQKWIVNESLGRYRGISCIGTKGAISQVTFSFLPCILPFRRWEMSVTICQVASEQHASLIELLRKKEGVRVFDSDKEFFVNITGDNDLSDVFEILSRLDYGFKELKLQEKISSLRPEPHLPMFSTRKAVEASQSGAVEASQFGAVDAAPVKKNYRTYGPKRQKLCTVNL